MRSALIAVGLLLTPPVPDAEMVSVPKAQLEALLQTHIAMRTAIEDQNKRIERMADAALACLSNFRSFREQ